MTTANTLLTRLSVDPELQPRGGHDLEIVAEYAQAMLDGATFPPLLAMWDGERLWLFDGFHRYYAYQEAGIDEAPVTFENGSKRDAFIRSLGTNAIHGQPRSWADKRSYVQKALADKDIAKLANREIARMCNVSHGFVADQRPNTVAKATAKARNDTKPSKDRIQSLKKTAGNVTSDGEAPEFANEAEELRARNAILAEEYEKMSDRLAVATMENVTDEERTLAIDALQELRDQVKTLTAENAALKLSRDSYLTENAALKEQIRRDRRAIDRFKESGVAKRAKRANAS